MGVEEGAAFAQTVGWHAEARRRPGRTRLSFPHNLPHIMPA